MANNRLALVCSLCNLGISIAKYYPVEPNQPGWYTTPLIADSERMNDFFLRHHHDLDSTFEGGNQYRLEYESTVSNWSYEQPTEQINFVEVESLNELPNAPSK